MSDVPLFINSGLKSPLMSPNPCAIGGLLPRSTKLEKPLVDECVGFDGSVVALPKPNRFAVVVMGVVEKSRDDDCGRPAGVKDLADDGGGPAGVVEGLSVIFEKLKLFWPDCGRTGVEKRGGVLDPSGSRKVISSSLNRATMWSGHRVK